MIQDDTFNDFDFYLKGIISAKQELDNYLKEVREIKECIKSLIWEDLLLEEKESGNSKSIKIRVPKNLKEQIVRLISSTNEF